MRSRLVALSLLVACVATVAPLFATALPPLYDYYYWVLEGSVVSGLVREGPEHSVDERSYELVGVPVPNLGAPAVLGLVSTVLPPLVAGRLFVAVCALGFALGSVSLARAVRGHSSPADLLVFPWALGYFVYKGYLSYFASIGLAFAGIALVHRRTRGGEAPVSHGGWAALAGMGAAIYLCHLAGWTVFATAIGAYAAALAARRGAREGARLLASLTPSCALLLWYALGSTGSRESALYSSIADKLRSLTEAGMLFVRLDPFDSGLPVLAANVAAIGALVGLACIFRLGGTSAGRSRIPLAVAGILAATAAALPYSDICGMGRPDERLVLPALFMLVAALPMRRFTPVGCAAAVTLILGVVGLHVGEYRSAGRSLGRIVDALRETVPHGAGTFSLELLRPGLGRGCRSDGPRSIGVPIAKWVGIVPLLESDSRRVNIMGTGALRRRRTAGETEDLYVTARTLDRIPELHARAAALASSYPYVVLLGCEEDVRAAEAALAGSYGSSRRGEGFAILAHPTDETVSSSAERGMTR